MFVFIIGVILSGCQKRSQHEQNKDHRSEGIEKFLRHALITHSGVFTLVGAKPITEFSNLTVEPSSERLLKIYENLSERAKEESSYEDVSGHFREEYELWLQWSNVMNKYIGENFRFFPAPHLKDRIFFANLDAVALTLDEYYEDFKRVYGFDFDPTEIVYSIDSVDSEFWKICFSDHYLAGLLYGFGKSNAKLFSWERKNKKPGKARGSSCNRSPVVNNPSMIQLLPPSFAIYSPLDEKLLFYRNIREEIIKLYEGKDFMEVTLKLLGDSEQSFIGLVD